MGEKSLAVSQSQPMETGQAAKRLTRLIKFLHTLASGEASKFKRARAFLFPFYIDEAFLRNLEREVRRALEKLPTDEAISFESVTRFRDLSTLRLISFKEFLERAGNRDDPESIRLEWNRFAVTENGEPISGSVSFHFVTEKKLESQDLPPGDFFHSFIELAVEGSDSEWVELTYEQLSPFVEASRLGGIYRPLWIFRNKWVIQTLAILFSWIGFFLGTNVASSILERDTILSRQDVLSRILSEPIVGHKIDIFATWMLEPPHNPWWEPVVVVGMGALSFAVIYVAGLNLLPKLTPSSHIAIGLSGMRARRYSNVFKFIVFDALILGILLPLLLKIITQIF